MGHSNDYTDVIDWKEKPEGYQTDSVVKYRGNIFKAAFWADKPGEGDPERNGWRLHDELYDLTSRSTSEPLKIIGYIPTWRSKEDFDSANADRYRYITHGIVAFLMFSEETIGEFEAKAATRVMNILPEVVSAGHSVGTKIMIALGGATDYGFLALMTAIGGNPSHPLLEKAVQKVVKFVEDNDLDGVDLDLECWWDRNSDPDKDQGGRKKSEGPHPAGRGLTLFAQRLKAAMPNKIVSAALFATSWYGNNYDAKLADHLDWVAVMTYDLTGSWNDSPVGPHTALYKIREEEQLSYQKEQQGEWPGKGPVHNPIHSVEDALWYWSNPFFSNSQGEGQNIPRHKLVGGVPIYGYDFAYEKEPDDLSGQIPPGYKMLRYKDILAQFPAAYRDSDAKIQQSGDTQRPPFRPSGRYPYRHNIYFETPDTAVEKLKFLKRVGTQGVIVWELSNDVWDEGKSIVKALYESSGNPAKGPGSNSSGDSDAQTPELYGYVAKLDFEVVKQREDETEDNFSGDYVRGHVVFYALDDDERAIADYHIGIDQGPTRLRLETMALLRGESFFTHEIEQMKRDDWELSLKIHTDEDFMDAVGEALFGGIGAGGKVKLKNSGKTKPKKSDKDEDDLEGKTEPERIAVDALTGIIGTPEFTEVKQLPQNLIVMEFRGKAGEFVGKTYFKVSDQLRPNYIPRLKRMRSDDEDFKSFGSP